MDVADQHRRIVERLDGEAEIVLLVRAPLRDALLRRGLRRRDTLRFVQLTPPGSACSIVLGTRITEMAPGSQKGVQMVVADAAAAREQLIARGVQASDVDVQPWGSFVFFSDPDGNTWSLQQLPAWQ
jgi:hypothetical protein